MIRVTLFRSLTPATNGSGLMQRRGSVEQDRLRRLKFRFTIFKGPVRTEDLIFFLTDIYHFYGDKVIIVWDNLSAHHAADAHFADTHPDWFEFEYFPPYSPELNPVEPCWNQIKNVYLPNFVPTSDDELVTAVHAAAMQINDEQLLQAFFKHANLKP